MENRSVRDHTHRSGPGSFRHGQRFLHCQLAVELKGRWMMTGKYILDKDSKPVLEPDILKWGQWFENSNRTVAKYEGEGYSVSTVFLGLDHQFGDGPPLVFETMIFGGPLDQYQERYCTWAEAEAGHLVAMSKAKMASN